MLFISRSYQGTKATFAALVEKLMDVLSQSITINKTENTFSLKAEADLLRANLNSWADQSWTEQLS